MVASNHRWHNWTFDLTLASRIYGCHFDFSVRCYSKDLIVRLLRTWITFFHCLTVNDYGITWVIDRRWRGCLWEWCGRLGTRSGRGLIWLCFFKGQLSGTSNTDSVIDGHLCWGRRRRGAIASNCHWLLTWGRDRAAMLKTDLRRRRGRRLCDGLCRWFDVGPIRGVISGGAWNSALSRTCRIGLGNPWWRAMSWAWIGRWYCRWYVRRHGQPCAVWRLIVLVGFDGLGLHAGHRFGNPCSSVHVRRFRRRHWCRPIKSFVDSIVLGLGFQRG